MKVSKKSRLLQFCMVMLAALVMFSMLPANTYAASTAKPGKVKTVKLVSSTESSLVIKWSKSSKAKKIQIAYKKVGAKKYKYKTLKATKKKYRITKLAANTKYIVRVRGLNGKQKGAWSTAKKFRTKVPETDTEEDIDYNKAADETQLKVSVSEDEVTISIASLGKSGNGILYSVPANQYMSGDNISGLVTANAAGTKIGTFALNKAKTFTLDRYTEDGADRLYDKYYVVQSGKIVKGPVYATEIAAKRGKVEMDTVSKKGLVDELDEESYELSEDIGSNWTALNIDFTSLIYANENANGKAIDNSHRNADTIEVNGKTYYINKTYVSELDYRLRRYQQMGINVVGICVSFVSTEKTSNYPHALLYIEDARWTNGFNTSNDLGRDYFIAGMEYLANRYSKGNKGLICDYVIGNEIDYTYDWYEIVDNESETGEPLPPRGDDEKYFRPGEIEVRAPFDTFMEEYSRTLRLANLAVKKYSNDIRVGVSLSKEWNMSRAKRENFSRTTNKRWDSYAPREILDWLNYYSKKSGDFNWTVTPHNYPMANCNSAAYETGLSEASGGKALITGDPDTTTLITLNNLEVLQLYLDRTHNLFNGAPREVFFTENGCSSGSEVGTPPAINQREQAAEIAQYYYRAASLPSVKAMIYYKIEDREAEGSTSFKLGLKDTTGANKMSYDVWKYIDTDKSFEVTERYLKNISFKKNDTEYSFDKGNISSWRDVMEVTASEFPWDKYWDEKAMTPVHVEEEQVDDKSLATDKTEYGADDPILVTAKGSTSDLVGLYKRGETPEDDAIYYYKVGGSENGVNHKSGIQYDIRLGAFTGTRREEAKLPAGEYSVILSANGEELKKVDITITGTSAYDAGNKVSVSKSEYKLGEDIVVSAGGTGKDWVGLYRIGDKPGEPNNDPSCSRSFFWYYVDNNDGTSAPHGIPGKPFIIQHGTQNVDRGSITPGQYLVILFSNDGYGEIARSDVFTVAEGEQSEVGDLESVDYILDNQTDGFANGTVIITKRDGSEATDCIMYWGDENGKPLEGYAHLAKFRLGKKAETEYTMLPNTIIPPGARTLIAHAVVGGKTAEESVMTTLPEGSDYKLDTDPNTWFPVFSDIHVVDEGSGNDYGQNTNYHFTAALEDTVKNLPGSAGVFINGDLADHGRASEFMTVFNLHKSVPGAPTMHISIGNHDWRTNNPDRQFQKYVNLYNPAVETDTVYYDEWIDGYHFIYLGGEAPGDNAELSQEQLKWLDDLLAADSEADQSRPVFLFLHQGLQDSMAGNYAGQWGYDHGVNQDSQLKSIVQKYGQVIMFGGHTHYELDSPNTITCGGEEFPVYVNTAAVGYLWNCYNIAAGEYMYGAHGYFLQVFDDKVYIFGRDFLSGEFMPSAMYVIDPVELSVAKSKVSMSVGDSAVNIGAATEQGIDITYRSSDANVAKVDSNGNIRAIGEGTAKIYVSAEATDTKAINRKIVTVTVNK